MAECLLHTASDQKTGAGEGLGTRLEPGYKARKRGVEESLHAYIKLIGLDCV